MREPARAIGPLPTKLQARSEQEPFPGLQIGNPGDLRDQSSNRGTYVPRHAYIVFRFSAADLPVLRSTTTSKDTRWPARSSRRPARSTALIWTNTSLPPPSG